MKMIDVWNSHTITACTRLILIQSFIVCLEYHGLFPISCFNYQSELSSMIQPGTCPVIKGEF